jgi:hypothetical protein
MPVFVKEAVIDANVNAQVAFVNATAAGNTQLVAAQAGLRIAVLAAAIVASGAVSVNLQSGTTAITATWAFAANGGLVLPKTGMPWAVTAAGQALNVNLSAAVVGGVGVHVVYAVIP